MDVYLGCNQILMHPKDEDKITFITLSANFCHRMMPFGLKNVRPTYQRMMNKILKDHIKNLIKVYIDDILKKITDAGNHMDDLCIIFNCLRVHNM